MFGANDKMFHIEFERPLFVRDIRPKHRVNNLDELISKSKHCEWDLVGSNRCKKINLDYTSFHASWLNKEFIEKVCTRYFRFHFLYITFMASLNCFEPVFTIACPNFHVKYLHIVLPKILENHDLRNR